MNTIIIILIIVNLIIHRYLTGFYEQKTLPHHMTFLIFANILVLIYLINFIRIFGIIIGTILSIMTFFQIVYSTLLWPFMIPQIIKIQKKNIIPKVNLTLYGSRSYIIILTSILTILNFFISDYKSGINIINNTNLNNYSLTIILLIIVLIIIIGNLSRILIMNKLIKIKH